MKQIWLLFFVLQGLTSPAQQRFISGSDIASSAIRPVTYKMRWTLQKDSVETYIGDVTTRLSIKHDSIYIVQNVNLKSGQGEWIDTTVASTLNLRPIYHSSYNQQRDMTLRYNDSVITGWYKDKRKGTESLVSDTARGWYFDSNIYHHLLAWLPLKVGYVSKIPIYNFSGPERMGVFSVAITGVKENLFSTSKKETVKVYEVDIIDEVSQLPAQYIIGQKNRKTYKISVQTPRGKMGMQLVDSGKK